MWITIWLATISCSDEPMWGARGVVLGLVAPSRGLRDAAVALGNPSTTLGRKLVAHWATAGPESTTIL